MYVCVNICLAVFAAAVRHKAEAKAGTDRLCSNIDQRQLTIYFKDSIQSALSLGYSKSLVISYVTVRVFFSKIILLL